MRFFKANTVFIETRHTRGDVEMTQIGLKRSQPAETDVLRR